MTATGWACQFRAPSERPESTLCGHSPLAAGRALDAPQQPFDRGGETGDPWPLLTQFQAGGLSNAQKLMVLIYRARRPLSASRCNCRSPSSCAL